MQNPYKTLGVSKDASHKDIKTAFFKLAKEHHPDKGGNPEEFKRINEAYDILKDPQKRQQFDLGGFNQQNPGNNSFSFSFVSCCFAILHGPQEEELKNKICFFDIKNFFLLKFCRNIITSLKEIYKLICNIFPAPSIS